MDECEKKRLTELAFRNRLILKDMLFGVSEKQDQERGA
jgi:hypothetical protein